MLGERQQSQGAACNLYLFDEVPGTVIERGTVESSKGEVRLGNSPLGKGKFNLKMGEIKDKNDMNLTESEDI